jgi:callose synthase
MEETLKMRNLLQEFLKKHDGVRYPSILGVREHIFTGRYSCELALPHKFVTMYTTSHLNYPMIACLLLQCFFSCVVHVKSRDKFCHYWTTGTCQSFEVIHLTMDIFFF